MGYIRSVIFYTAILLVHFIQPCTLSKDKTSIICDNTGVDLKNLKLENSFSDGNFFRSSKGQAIDQKASDEKAPPASPFVLNASFLRRMPKLSSFLAEESGLKELPNNMFALNKNLNHIVFSFNNIKTLPKSLLPKDSSNLKELKLDHNKISSIPEDFFKTAKNLEVLHLEYNFITRLPKDFLLGCEKILELYLHDNNLVSFGRNYNFPSTLSNIYLQNNKLISGSFENGNNGESVFKNAKDLKILNLANNHISWLSPGTLKGLTSLSHIYLENNRFLQIERDFFNTTTALKYIYLGSNYLKKLPMGIFGHCSELAKIGLDDNYLREAHFSMILYIPKMAFFHRF